MVNGNNRQEPMVMAYYTILNFAWRELRKSTKQNLTDIYSVL
jgi:hypothetical protein